MADLSEEQQAQLLFFVTAQASAHDRVRSTVLDEVVRVMRASLVGRWYNDAAVRRAARELGDVILRGQTLTRDITQTYLDQVLSVFDVPTSRTPIRLPEPLRGIDAETEWGRPAKEYRRARLIGLDKLSQQDLASVGEPPPDGERSKPGAHRFKLEGGRMVPMSDQEIQDELAQQRAAQRARLLASDDLDLAMRETARQRLAPVDRVIGTRRVIHPERSQSGTCGLCIAAADRIYRKTDLLPMHGGCKCVPFPVIRGKADPARTFNEVDTAELYRRVLEASGSTARDALRRTRVQINQHGELGPVLHDAGHRFRGQREAARDLRDPGELDIA